MDEYYWDIDIVERMIMWSPLTIFIFVQWARWAMWTMVAKTCMDYTQAMAKHSDWPIMICICGQIFQLAHCNMEPRQLTCAMVDKLSPNIEQFNDIACHASMNEQSSL